MRRVALATCAELPDGDEDFPPLIAALAAEGIESEAGRLGRRRRRLELLRPRPSALDLGLRRAPRRLPRLGRVAAARPEPARRCSSGTRTSSDTSTDLAARRRAGRADDVRRARRRARAAGRSVRGQAGGLGGRAQLGAVRRPRARRRRGARRPHPRRGPHGDGPAVPRRPRRKGARLPGRRVLARSPAPRAAARGGGRATSSTSTRTSARRRRPMRRRTSPARRSPAPPRRFSTGAST